MRFKDKIVVVTGASSGIGEHACIDFAKKGAKVVLVSRSKDKIENIAGKIERDYQTKTLPIPCDVSKKEEVLSMSKRVLGEFAHVDVLVNNAGFGIFGSVNDLGIDELEQQLTTNLLGTIYCTKAFLSSMLGRKTGHIVNVASVAGSIGIPGMAAYCASKFAMLGFSQSLYHELSGTGVRVTVVSPITVKTNFFEHPSFKSIKPRYTPVALSVEHVSRAILRAANSRRMEIIVPFYVRGAVWFTQTFPYLINPFLGYAFRRELKKLEDQSATS